MEFNFVNTNEDIFDEYFNNKRDLGKVIRDIAQLIGVKQSIQIINPKLEQAVLNARANPDDLNTWIIIHAILTAYEQLTRIVNYTELPDLENMLLVIFELPSDKYLAFRFICTHIITDITYCIKEGRGEVNEVLAQKFMKFATDGLKC